MKANGLLRIPDSEVSLRAVRSQGAGGQNVNKVATAIHLRFEITSSSLPDEIKGRLLKMNDRRITADGTIIIKAQRHRTQEQNRRDALGRLTSLISEASHEERSRRKTRPTKASNLRRLQQKERRSRIKNLRRPVDY